MMDVFVRAGPGADTVVGLGARGAAGADEILQLIDESLALAGLDRSAIAACVTVAARRNHAGLVAAAAALGVPLLALDSDDLGGSVPNPSSRVAELAGLASVAEAAALYFGPLVLEKRRSASATCALARRVDYSANAAITASTLVTSRAGA